MDTPPPNPTTSEIHPALAVPREPRAPDALVEAIRADLRSVLDAPELGIAELRRLSRESEAAAALLLSRSGAELHKPEDDEQAPEVQTPVTETYGATVIRELIAALPGLKRPDSEPIPDLTLVLRAERARTCVEMIQMLHDADDVPSAIERLREAARANHVVLDMPGAIDGAIDAVMNDLAQEAR